MAKTDADFRLTFTNALAAALGWTPCRWDHNADDGTEGFSDPNYSYSVCREPWEALQPPSLRRMARLYLSFDGYKNEGRVRISGEGMTDAQGKAFDLYYITKSDESRAWPSMTAAYNRPIAVIAAEVKRKLLPEYLRLHSLAWDKVHSERKDLDANRALAHGIAQALGPKAVVSEKCSGGQISIRLAGEEINGREPEVRVECNWGRLSLEVSGVGNDERLAPLLNALRAAIV